MSNKVLKDDLPSDFRTALNALIRDETEAIQGYDDTLLITRILPEDRAKLEEIRNEEIVHIIELSNIYKKLATGKVDEHIQEALSDASIYETDKPNVKWEIHQDKWGKFYFENPDGDIYTENGKEVSFGSKEVAGKFFLQKLFNKSLWGNTIPRVVVDSKTVAKRVRDSKGFVVGNNSKTEFLRWSNDKYIVAKSPDAATLYPTVGSARVSLELANWDNKKYHIFGLNNSYELLDSSVAKFRVGETVEVYEYGAFLKEKIRKVLTREEAEKQFNSVVSGTSDDIKHWYILESTNVPKPESIISHIG